VKRILVVSDLHVGSTVAVMPDEVYVEKTNQDESAIFTPNAAQKILWRNWCDMVDEVGRVDGLFVLGDCIDGPNVKTMGAGTWTTDIHLQRREAIGLLKMVKYRSPKGIFGVDGSPYHRGANPTWDGDVIRALGGDFDTWQTVNMEGKRIHLCHWTGFSKSMAGQETSVSTEQMWVSANERWYGRFDLLLRGHIHQHRNRPSLYGHTLVAPGWKLLDNHMKTGGLRGQPPQCGYWLLTLKEGHDISIENHIWVAPMRHLIREVYL
jgi:calcineurin-like phosphoesterase family protein